MRPEGLEPQIVILTCIIGLRHNYYPLGYRIVYMPAGLPPLNHPCPDPILWSGPTSWRRRGLKEERHPRPQIAKNLTHPAALPEGYWVARKRGPGSRVVRGAGVGGKIDKKKTRSSKIRAFYRKRGVF